MQCMGCVQKQHCHSCFFSVHTIPVIPVVSSFFSFFQYFFRIFPRGFFINGCNMFSRNHLYIPARPAVHHKETGGKFGFRPSAAYIRKGRRRFLRLCVGASLMAQKIFRQLILSARGLAVIHYINHRYQNQHDRSEGCHRCHDEPPPHFFQHAVSSNEYPAPRTVRISTLLPICRSFLRTNPI